MNKIFLITLILLLSKLINGQPVDENLVSIVAKNFFASKYNKSISETVIKNTITKKYNGENSYFISNFERGGWVIVSSHKAIGPVLAYSDNGIISSENAPDVFWDWMQQYELMIDCARKKNWYREEKRKKWDLLTDTTGTFHENKLKSITYTTPFYLLNSLWGQSTTNDIYCPGYNALAPTNGSCLCDRCYAGCVAVAMAQILNYWGFAAGDYADFNWWNMPCEELFYLDNPNYNSERDAVAYLLNRCAVEVDMDFCAEECQSSANTLKAKDAYIDYQYNSQTINYERKIFHTYTAWVNMLKNELDNGRPVHYRYIGKHSFVCDGHDGDNTFHFNFGWNGSCNGFYDVEDLMDDNCQGPCNYVFDYSNLINHACYVGIKPDAPTSLTLQNFPIFPGQNYTFQTMSTIYAAGNNTYFLIMSNSICRFVAGEYIQLNPGVHIESGSSFLAKIFSKSSSLKSAISFSNNNNIENSEPLTDIYSKKLADFYIYPNPTNGIFYLHTKEPNIKIRVELFDLYGKIVFQSEYKYVNNIKVNISTLRNGVYILKIDYNKYNFNYKIINLIIR